MVRFPRDEHAYFVLNRASWLCSGWNKQSSLIHIPLDSRLYFKASLVKRPQYSASIILCIYYNVVAILKIISKTFFFYFSYCQLKQLEGKK